MRNAGDVGVPSRNHRPVRLLALVAITIVLASPIAPIFVPYVDSAKTADAVMVLGPADTSRIGLAENFMREYGATTLVVSASPTADLFRSSKLDVCNGDRDYEVICVRPEPFTTQGEVAYLSYFADREAWESVIVVTDETHATRTRLYLDRCFAQDATVAFPEREFSWIYTMQQYFYQAGGFLKAFLVTRDCS